MSDGNWQDRHGDRWNKQEHVGKPQGNTGWCDAPDCWCCYGKVAPAPSPVAPAPTHASPSANMFEVGSEVWVDGQVEHVDEFPSGNVYSVAFCGGHVHEFDAESLRLKDMACESERTIALKRIYQRGKKDGVLELSEMLSAVAEDTEQPDLGELVAEQTKLIINEIDEERTKLAALAPVATGETGQCPTCKGIKRLKRFDGLGTVRCPDCAAQPAGTQLLRTALERIEDIAPGHGDVCELIAKTARKALMEADVLAGEREAQEPSK